MFPIGFIDMVRKGAYPTRAPEGVEYERDRVRDALQAIAGFKHGKDGHGRAIRAAREEAERVFNVAMNAVFGDHPS
jgi:hypothetical protein